MTVQQTGRRPAAGSRNPESIARRIGPRIRARRVELGISVRELARRIDVSASFVSLVETGRCAPSVSTFRALASELDISATELLASERAEAGVARAGREAPPATPTR